MSVTLQKTIDWASPIIRFLPLNIGANSEPAITNANIVQQTIMGPPFCWDWNRSSLTFNTVADQQDYVQLVNDFGFIEKATVSFNGEVKEITVRDSLSLDSRVGRPEYISSQIDNNAGNITFRLMKKPDVIYSVNVIYQKKASLFTALSDTWSIPDKYSYIYNYGFLTLAMLHLDDPRIAYYNQKFMSALLGTNHGLTEMQRNIFVGNWLALTGQESAYSIRTQQAQIARGT